MALGRGLSPCRYGLGLDDPFHQGEYQGVEGNSIAVRSVLTKLCGSKRAAVSRDQKPTPSRLATSDPNTPWLKRKISDTMSAVYDLLRNPAYSVPLLLNVTGSVWFFLLIGQAGTSLCEIEK